MFAKIQALFRVFALGATIRDRVGLFFFYKRRFLQNRIPFLSASTKLCRYTIRFENGVYQVFLRQILDIHVLREMFVDEQYRIDHSETVKNVLDIGANVGFSLIYFAHKFPNARIIAVEPHPGCQEQLLAHARQFGERVIVVPKALSNAGGSVTFYLNQEHWSASIYKRRDSKEVTVETISLRVLLDMFHGQSVDVMKCDIEGAEFEAVLPEDLNSVRILIAELHPDIAHVNVDAYLDRFTDFICVERKPIGQHVHVILKKK